MTYRQTIRQGRVVWEILLDGKLLARVESKEQAKRLAKMLSGVSDKRDAQTLEQYL